MATTWISGYDARDFGDRRHSQPVLGLAVLDNTGTLFADYDDDDQAPEPAEFITVTPSPWMRAVVLAAAGLPDLAEPEAAE